MLHSRLHCCPTNTSTRKQDSHRTMLYSMILTMPVSVVTEQIRTVKRSDIYWWVWHWALALPSAILPLLWLLSSRDLQGHNKTSLFLSKSSSCVYGECWCVVNVGQRCLLSDWVCWWFQVGWTCDFWKWLSVIPDYDRWATDKSLTYMSSAITLFYIIWKDGGNPKALWVVKKWTSKLNDLSF